MKIVRDPHELEAGKKKVCLAIGMFDGLHLGHQHVLRQAVEDARQHEGLAVTVTFDRHPASVLAGRDMPLLLQTLPQKLRSIEATGMDALYLIRFDAEFSRQPAEAFVQSLLDGFSKIHCVCVGSKFAFGQGRKGDVELLRDLGREHGFGVHGMQAVSLNGQPVSSTRIRQTIEIGDLDAAGQMLGRTFALEGTVVRGEGRGRELGFPTANLDTAGIALPPFGVYVAHARVDGCKYQALLNVGVRPTVETNGKTLVEAHLLDFQGDLYGKTLEAIFVEWLRGEQQFESPVQLSEQIARDTARARAIF